MSGLTLTILGNNGGVPVAGGACSGYLIRAGGISLLVDCGSGVLSNLLKFISFNDIDAIILTHLHGDHISDMLSLQYDYPVKHKRGLSGKIIDVYAPPEPAAEFARLDIRNAFSLMPLHEELVLSFEVKSLDAKSAGGSDTSDLNVVNSIKLTFKEMTHPIRSYAVSVEYGGRRLVYSGDASWDEGIIEFSRGADLLLLDAGLLAAHKTTKNKSDGSVPHLTAEECGEVAALAGAKRLLLTHIWAYADPVEVKAEAMVNFPGAELAKLLETYQV